MIVVDASVVVDAYGGDGNRALAAREILRTSDLQAPTHLDIEAVSSWRRHVHRGQISPERAMEAIDLLGRSAIRRLPVQPLLRRAWELRSSLTIQDAVYVALAEQLEVPLFTGDAAMTRAPGARCEFRLIS